MQNLADLHWLSTAVQNYQGCRGYGDSHGDSHGYGYGMGMGTVMNPHGFCGDSVGIFEWM